MAGGNRSSRPSCRESSKDAVANRVRLLTTSRHGALRSHRLEKSTVFPLCMAQFNRVVPFTATTPCRRTGRRPSLPAPARASSVKRSRGSSSPRKAPPLWEPIRLGQPNAAYGSSRRNWKVDISSPSCDTAARTQRSDSGKRPREHLPKRFVGRNAQDQSTAGVILLDEPGCRYWNVERAQLGENAVARGVCDAEARLIHSTTVAAPGDPCSHRDSDGAATEQSQEPERGRPLILLVDPGYQIDPSIFGRRQTRHEGDDLCGIVGVEVHLLDVP